MIGDDHSSLEAAGMNRKTGREDVSGGWSLSHPSIGFSGGDYPDHKSEYQPKNDGIRPYAHNRIKDGPPNKEKQKEKGHNEQNTGGCSKQ
jgi:hypothetical protein